MAKLPRPAGARPNPDVLLAMAEREERGRLTVFLGAAPGVGKTYAMLQRAHRAHEGGVDVVVGLVETHGRPDTASLVEGLEVLPRKRVDYRGRMLDEFDLDAALARKPKLLLLDELAHSNPPDFRHPKRWQDAQELIDAGIDVWTALNIQHIESLADVVSRITGVTVRETVPDTVLNESADVILVDITPDELIGRLRDGKVYVPETARRATQNFFTPANLTALRELALRRTADRVDDQVADYQRQKVGTKGRGAAERLLVCIAADGSAEPLIRHTARLASSLNAQWTALHLNRPGSDQLTAERQRIAAAFELAKRLGAETTELTATDFVDEVLRFAEREGATQIVVAASGQSSFTRWLKTSLSAALIQRANTISISVVPVERSDVRPSSRLRGFARAGFGYEFLVASLAVGLAVGVGELLSLWLLLPNLSMIFLCAVFLCALRLGVRAAVLASGLSFFAYNFFFIEPLYTFTIAQPHELLSLLVFLVIAALTGRLREQTRVVLKRVQTTQALYEFSRKLAAAKQADDLVWAAVTHLHNATTRPVLIAMPIADDLVVRAAWPPDATLDTGEASAARWALEKSEPAGAATGTLAGLRKQFRPVSTNRATIAVCGIDLGDRPVSREEEETISAVLDQTAIALDRALLVDEAVKAAAFEESERLRDALFASLTHDLRTPLASITGAVTTLRTLRENLSGAQQDELLQAIEQESARLTRFVANLLDMSRIESGALKVRRDWVDVADVIHSAVERARKEFSGSPTQASIAPDLPFMRGDSNLLEQVIFNLLDNAHKYGGETGAFVHARRDGDMLLISVTDEGPGIKPADLPKIFEKFWRGGRNDGRRAGTGLGLSICRGLVEAMGGTIEGQSPAARRLSVCGTQLTSNA